MSLSDLIKGLKEFERNLDSYIVEVLHKNDSIIVEMNSEEQLFEKGITREGTSIDSYAPYSPITIEIKKDKGQPTNRVTLRDEGDFEDSFFVDIKEHSFEIKASDWKSGNLQAYYGDEILGLTDENLIDLARNYVLPYLLEKLKKI
jgi:hypothetical protein